MLTTPGFSFYFTAIPKKMATQPKKQTKGFKHNAGDTPYSIFWECFGSICKALGYIGHIIIAWFEHK